VFIIGPDKKLKLSLNYPASVGRNMDEVVRCIDALMLSADK
jgi:1-Cys peroxiredoxin 6